MFGYLEEEENAFLNFRDRGSLLHLPPCVQWVNEEPFLSLVGSKRIFRSKSKKISKWWKNSCLEPVPSASISLHIYGQCYGGLGVQIRCLEEQYIPERVREKFHLFISKEQVAGGLEIIIRFKGQPKNSRRIRERGNLLNSHWIFAISKRL